MGIQPISVPPSLAYVLNSAGDKSGVDFDYLLRTAMRESSLDPAAKSPSSSAVGLFQFLDTTWLQVMKTEGPRLGYQAYADAIVPDGHGNLDIKDKALKAEVLKLRENPQVAADMAAAFTRDNGEYLQAKFGRMPSPGELYIAHFLGAQGAEKLFRAGLQNPDQIAASLFPQQAASNRAIFYGSDGHARTIREVYQALVGQHPQAPIAAPAGFAAQQIANAPAQPGVPEGGDTPLPSRFGPKDMSFTTLFSTEAQGATGSPVQAVEPVQGAAFFTQIYGQN